MRALAIVILASGLASSMAWGSAEAAPLENCVKAEEAYQAGSHELEIEHYTRCIDEDGPSGVKLAIAHNNRGVAHLVVGDADSAIEDYDRALLLDPAYAIARTNRGMAHVAKGTFVQALRDYDKALELDPAYGPAYASRCWLFGFMGYGDTALADCDESLRLNPLDAAALDSRAFAYWLLKEQERARLDLELAREIDPARPLWRETASALKAFGGGFAAVLLVGLVLRIGLALVSIGSNDIVTWRGFAAALGRRVTGSEWFSNLTHRAKPVIDLDDASAAKLSDALDQARADRDWQRWTTLRAGSVEAALAWASTPSSGINAHLPQ